MGIRKVVANNIKKYRSEKGFSQEELAFEAELDRTYINAIENQKRNPSIETIASIAKALSVTPDSLLKE